MEQAPQHPDDNKHLPGEIADEAAILPFPGTIGFEFGHLDPRTPEGGTWDEWVISQGIEGARENERPIDDRTARNIAAWLRDRATPALRRFVATGAIDEPQVQEELVHHFHGQTEQVQSWVNSLGAYCLQREDKGPVEDWRESINKQDRAELERLRRERVLAELDALFSGPSADVTDSAGGAGRIRLVRYADQAGGLILQQDEHGFREVWGTDSDAELAEHWSAVSQGYEDVGQLGRWIVARTGPSPVPEWRQGPEVTRPFGNSMEADAESDDADSPAAPGGEQLEDTSAHEAASVPTRLDRPAGLNERLAPLPDLGDIPEPRLAQPYESGFDWMDQLPAGWHAEPSWGRDGWDLGTWPTIVVALFVDEEHERYAVATYTEGDVAVRHYASRGALYVAVNEVAEFHWRLGQALGPRDLPEGRGLLAKHCGPYSEERHRREVEGEE